jgi:hypothetical protein
MEKGCEVCKQIAQTENCNECGLSLCLKDIPNHHLICIRRSVCWLCTIDELNPCSFYCKHSVCQKAYCSNHYEIYHDFLTSQRLTRHDEPLRYIPAALEAKTEFEGIKLTNLRISKREETLTNIVNLVNAHSSVLIKGTRFTGKTSLCQLLTKKLTDDGMKVFHTTFLWKKRDEKTIDYLTSKGFDFKNQSQSNTQYYYIFDEAQSVYNDPDFWMMVKALVQEQTIKLIFFAAYTYTNESKDVLNVTPADCFDKRLCLSDILLTQNEYKELVEKHNMYCHVAISPEVKSFLWEWCGGNVATTGSTLTRLENLYKTKQPDEVIFSYLRSTDYSNFISTLRFMPEEDLTEDERSLINNVLIRNNIDLIVDNLNNEIKIYRSLVKKGFLAEMRECIFDFPSPVLKLLLFRKLNDIVRNPITLTSFKDFLIESLRV